MRAPRLRPWWQLLIITTMMPFKLLADGIDAVWDFVVDRLPR